MTQNDDQVQTYRPDLIERGGQIIASKRTPKAREPKAPVNTTAAKKPRSAATGQSR